LPTFLKLAQYGGYFKPVSEVEPINYPFEISITMPKIPFNAGRDEQTHRPFVYLFDRTEELLNKIKFTNGQKRKLILKMDELSFEYFYDDVPSRSDDNMFGDALFALISIKDYAEQRFKEKQLRVLSTGFSTNHEGITLELQRIE